MQHGVYIQKVKNIKEFKRLLEVTSANENEIQAFLEANTHFMPTPDLLNHQLHLTSVIAKFPIGDRYTDYAYLTKSTIEWQLTLVELEDSSKPIFKKSDKNLAFSSKFNDAVAQVDIWRDFARKNCDQIRDRLRPLMVPPQMSQNSLSINYVLVIGRSHELENNEARRARLSQFGKSHNLRILTYDTIIREVEAGRSKPKAVLRTNSRGFVLQSAEAMPAHMFSQIMPEHLELKPKAEAALRENQYDIDAWKQNELLVLNEKWTCQSARELMEEVHPAIAKLISR